MENSQIKRVSTHELFPIVVELLNSNKEAAFTISGISMMPFLVNNRDSVLIKKADFTTLKKGDIILFQLDSGKYILHRIYKLESGGYRTIGDNCIGDDGFIPYDNIIGVVSKIYRKCKQINCNSAGWRLFSWWWVNTMPIRKYQMYMYFKLAVIKQKIYERFYP